MVAYEDARKAFVVETIAGAIAPAPDQKATYAEYLARDDSGAIAAFLEDAGTNLLQVSIAKSPNGQLQVRLTNTADFPQACFYQLTLSKVQPGAVTLADIPGGIALSTVVNSPLSSLYHSLSNVYYPLLGIEQQGSAGMGQLKKQQQHVDPKLEELLLHVQAGLGKVVRGADANQVGDQAAPSLYEIQTPLDEIKYWADLAANPAMGVHAKAAVQVLNQLDALQQPLTELSNGSIEGDWEGALELVGRLGDALRQVWPLKMPPAGWAYPQKRMQHLLKVIGMAFAMFVQRKLQGVDLWRTSFNVLKGSLITAGQLLGSWSIEAHTLTGDWAVGLDAGGHLWEGQACADSYIAAFQERIEQIYALRDLHEELSALLSQEEASALGLGSVFAPFAQLAALHVSDFTAAAWATAQAEHERRLEGVETRISQKLKELFATVLIPNMVLSISQQAGQHGGPSATAGAAAAVAHPQQLFQELRQYSRLLGRPRLTAVLQAEQLALAKQIDLYLEQLQQEFDQQLDGGRSRAVASTTGRLMHGAADKIAWLMQCQAKASSVQDTLQLLVSRGRNSSAPAAAATEEGDSPAVAALKSCLGAAVSLVKALETHKKELFQMWQDEVQSQLQDMASWKSSRLMTFDAASSHIRCHFNESLVGLLREVRQLQALGFNMKRDVLAEMETASKFYRYGMVLQQCAHFYNNIATEMIPCQKPMMLAEAVEFEKVLMNPKDATGRDITWHNASALEGYVRRLSAVAERLAMSNRRLRQWHSVLAGKVVTLMGTDLVRHKDKWVATVKEMREIFSSLEGQGYPRERQEVWRHHWDFQLYKALEVQFRAGLENINKTLPEMEVSLVYRHHKLQYDPPLVELRMAHVAKHLNGFLGLPLRMKGVSSLSERQGFFAAIADADPAAIARVYESCEALFASLADEAKKYQDWLVLGDVAGDLEDHVEQQLCGGGVVSSAEDGGSSAGGAGSAAAGGDVGDWELNLRMLKTAARDLEKLRNEVRLDCYRVSLSPFKAYVEEMIKRLREALGSSLRKKALAERQAIDDFLAAGSALLGLQATSVEEIGRAGQEARALVARLGEVPQLRKRIEEKNRLLRQMAAAAPAGTTASSSLTPVDLSGLGERWDGFVGQLQAYDSHLEQQRQGLQGLLVKKIEDFKGVVAGFASRWQSIKPRSGPSGNPAVVMAQLEDAARQLEDVKEEAEQLCKECEALGVAPPALPQLDEVSADLAATQASWGGYRDFLEERDSLAHRDWLSMRDQVWKIEDFLTKWEGTCSGASASDPGKAAIALVLLQEIDTYRRCLPHLKTCMRGVGWEDSHWVQLFAMLGFKSGSLTKESVTLAHFLDKADAIIAHVEQIKSLDAMAQGEALIRKALSELKLWGLQRLFTFVANNERSAASGSTAGGAGGTGVAAGTAAGGAKGVPLIKEWSDVLSELGNHQSLVASLKTSHYYHLFKDEVASWESRLSTLLEGLGLLQGIQRRWLYLEPIFRRGALPAVAGRFRHVDGEFRSIMVQLEASCKVVAFADVSGVLARLSSMAAQLDACQRALSEFLEEKRAAFPRFYFLGDDDLLEVLGQAASLGVIQTHLKKLFAGIHRVRFSPDQSFITTMTSAEGEAVELTAPVKVTDTIEVWLDQLTGSMRSTLQASLSGLASLQDPLSQAPAQVLGLYRALRFTERVESAIRSGSLPQLASELRQELSALSSKDYSGHSLLQLKKQGLIIDLMHSCDVVEGLLHSREGQELPPSSPEEWAWARQLRYYAGQDGSVSVAMAEASLSYTWEYAGNAPKLVVTPLTDRCFLTLTQALALGYGGNPYGPAGTGKTESVKALGQALGRQVLVFNCDEEFDVRAMGRIFIGLLRCGAWGCFDEFNRLGEDVLSAVSQQVQAIQTALKEGTKQMSFMDKLVEVNPAAGVFVTLNPAGKGYGGRSKLPDNLKQMFRPIAMSVPDNDLIAEVLLASEGFSSAKALASKLVALFNLSKEGLSHQQHYDWGLRALKTCLGAAGKLLRQHCKSQSASVASPQDPSSEAGVVVRAVCATKLPTLTFEDVGRFRGLLGDIFPGTAISDTTYPELEAALQQAAEDAGLRLTPQQVERMLQLHLACEQRIGVIIVGPSGSGKSTLWQVLERGLEKLGSRPVVYRMNPKAMPRQQLLGSLNLDTREWSDGVLTAAARKVVQEPLEQRSWIVCDGDVDPEWIESLNSVLDDNRLLTMPNGERIQFGPNVNLIFECDSLAYASPATVSRCGMLFMSDAAIDSAAVMTKWLTQHPAADPSGKAVSWFSQLFPKAYDLALTQPVVVPSTKFGLLENVLSHLAAGVGSRRDLMVGLAKGLGYTLSPDVRQEFVAQLMRLTGSEGAGGDPLAVPASDDPLACLLEQHQQGLGPGGGAEMGMLNPRALDYLDHRLMLTDDVRGLLAVLAPWLAGQEPFLLVGPEGCGKSTLLDYCFSRLPGRVTVATVHCNAQTSADNVIQKLLQVCGKPVTTNQGKCLRPDTGRVILYLKDINLPKPDKYETMQVVAFAQQLLTHGGYYDEHLEFIRLERVQVVASMVPGSSAGRSLLSKRFTARLRLAVMSYPDAQQLEAIYTRMIQQVFGSSSQKQAAALANQAPSLARCMVELYQQLQATFKSGGGSGKVHCSFNPRHITSWVQGLQRYDLSQVDIVEAVAAEGLATFRGCLPDEGAAKQLDDLMLAALRTGLGYRGGLPNHLFSSLAASPETRLAAAAAGQAMPLGRWSLDDAGGIMGGVMKSFNREAADTQLLMVPQALQRVVALDRFLSVPAGAVLLCGPAGSGRRSMAQLVAHAHGLRWWSPRISRRFDAAAFRVELKDVLRTAGIEGTPLLLFLEERHLGADPGVLELLNCLLSAGEVPGLFGGEELAKELAALEGKRDKDTQYQGPPSNYAYFLACLHRHLRIAISLDPSSEAFCSRLDQNPALLNRCSMLWWQGWSSASLQAIAQERLQGVLSSLACSEPERSELLSSLLKLHASAAGQLAAAPRHFMAAADLYGATITTKRGQLLQQQQFLKSGLDRLAEAASTVDELSRQAEAQRSLLATKQAEADTALTHIQSSMEAAADRRHEVELLRQQLGETEATLQKQRGQVEAQLADVQPLIDAARAAVGGIKADHINEVRSLRMAPDVIRDVLEGVLLLMGQEDTSWVAMKAFLGKRSVKEDIINYDAHRILSTPGLRAKLDKLMAAKGASFEKEAAYRASQAAGPMAVWVSANVSYSVVLKQIAPLESQLASLKSGLADSQERLSQCQAELGVLDEQVVRLKTDFQLRIREAEALKLELARAEGTLTAASDLLSKLSGERTRWGQQLAGLDGQLSELPRAALLLAAFITYLPAHPEDVRERVMQGWASQLSLPGFSPTAFMSSEAQQLTWQGQGLPSDSLSGQNALAILHGVQTPLVIDPSSQAIEWLKAHIKAQGAACDVVAQHDPHFNNSLELAVRFGKVLVVSEVDRVHPILYPLLRNDVEKQGGRLVVPVGDKLVDHNPSFKLYLVTRNASPALTPDVLPLLTVTNFSITRSGLESQLLSVTLQHEQPELESRKALLLASEAGLKLQLAELEKRLLQALATSSGNLLEDTALLTSLNETKAQASNVAAALEDGRTLAAQLDEQRSAYRPLAARGSLLYFTLVQLRQLDPMYCFSLTSFLKLFRQLFKLAAQTAGPANSRPRDSTSSQAGMLARNALLCDKLLELVHASVSRALFNKDQLTLAVHLARSLLPDQFPAEEWAAFLSCNSSMTGGSAGGGSAAAGGSAADAAIGSGAGSFAGVAVPPMPSWIRADKAAAYEQLAAALPNLVAAAQLQDARMWAPWAASTVGIATGGGSGGGYGAGVEFVPPGVAGRLTGLQQLILVAAFRPDCLPAATSTLMCQLLHLPNLTPAPLSMRQLLEAQDSSGSSGREAVLFITTPGADPSQELAAFAEGQVGRDRLHEVAMGQGQSEVALQLIRECAKTGDWLLLKNLHLVVSWLPVLEKEMHSLRPDSRDQGFRLFLTSEPHAKFPSTLLEGALKIVFEAPPGVKMNLQRTYSLWRTDFLAGHVTTPAAAGAGSSSSSSLAGLQAVPQSLVPLRAQLLFLLAWFNAVVQERRNYVPFGWSTAYDFSVADLRAGADVVARAAASSGPGGPDWQQLLGLLQVIYGGRVDAKQDTKVLLAHLSRIINPDLLTALPAAAAAGRRTNSQQRRLPGLAPTAGPLPCSGVKQDWQAFIATLPDADVPELFGLPANIERAVALASSRQLLGALRQMGAAQGAAAAFDRQVWSTLLQPLVKLWDQLLALAPPSLRQLIAASSPATAAAAASSASPGLDTAADASGDGGGPVGTFVSLERAFGVALLRLVGQVMCGIKAVMAGEAPLTAALQVSASSLLQGQVCADWDLHWEGPSSPSDYIRAAVRKAGAVETWASLTNKPGGLLAHAGCSAQAPLDLGQLFRPGAFLNALRQQAARSAGVPLGNLRLVSCWPGGRLPSSCPVAVHVAGIMLQGALFDGHSLSPAWQDSPLTSAAPACVLAWLPPAAAPPHPQAMSVPLYLTPEGRSRVVAELQLPLAGGAEQQQWTLAGVGLLLPA